MCNTSKPSLFNYLGQGQSWTQFYYGGMLDRQAIRLGILVDLLEQTERLIDLPHPLLEDKVFHDGLGLGVGAKDDEPALVADLEALARAEPDGELDKRAGLVERRRPHGHHRQLALLRRRGMLHPADQMARAVRAQQSPALLAQELDHQRMQGSLHLLVLKLARGDRLVGQDDGLVGLVDKLRHPCRIGRREHRVDVLLRLALAEPLAPGLLEKG